MTTQSCTYLVEHLGRLDSTREAAPGESYACRVGGCRHSFSSLSRVKRHYRDVHLIDLDFIVKCSNCNKSFDKSMGRYFIKDFNRHPCSGSEVALPSGRASSDAGEIGLNFLCPYGCGRSFKSKRRLTNHKKSHERRGEAIPENTNPSSTQISSLQSPSSGSAGNSLTSTTDGPLRSDNAGPNTPSLCSSSPNPVLSMLLGIDSSPPAVPPTPVITSGEPPYLVPSTDHHC